MTNSKLPSRSDLSKAPAQEAQAPQDRPANVPASQATPPKQPRKLLAREVLAEKKKPQAEDEALEAKHDGVPEADAAAAAEDAALGVPSAEPGWLVAQAGTGSVSDAGSGAGAGGAGAGSAWAKPVESGGSGTGVAASPLGFFQLALAAGGVLIADQIFNGSSSTAAISTPPPPVAPAFQSLAVRSGGAGTATIELNYDRELDAANPPAASAFVVKIDGAGNKVAGVSVSGSKVTLTLTDAVAAGSLSVSVDYLDSAANDAQAIQDKAGVDAASLNIVSGVVADGYIRGAKVYVDTNGDGQGTAADHYVGETDAEGRFFISKNAPSGKLVVTGGINTDTGVENKLTLKAPAPDLSKPVVVNPLTTVITSVMSGNVTAAQAASKVAQALGLNLPAGSDLLSIDPIAAAKDTATAETFGLAAQKAAANIATIAAIASSDPSANAATAPTRVIENLAAVIKAATATTPAVDLTTTSTLDKLLAGAVSTDAAKTLTASDSRLVSAVKDIQAATSVKDVASAQSQYLDTVAPDAPTSLVLDSLTRDSTPQVRVNLNVASLDGKAVVEGDTIELYEGNTLLASAKLSDADVANGFALISPDPAKALTQGAHTLSVKIKDNAGTPNVSSAATASVSIDTDAPSISSGATGTPTNENASAGATVYTATATDAHGITYSLKAGVGDASALTMNATTGVVTLNPSPDFETKNSYAFTVVATDAAGNASEQAVTVAINNLDEVAPTITSTGVAQALNENTAAGQVVYTVTSTDAADIATGATAYSLKASTGDAAAFRIDPATGAVTLTASPDHEAKSSYSFTVLATDAAGNVSEQVVTLAIGDINEPPTAVAMSSTLANSSVAENTATTARIKVADILVTDDALGTETIALSGADKDSFEVEAGVLYLKAGTVLNFEAKTSYAVTVSVADSTLGASTPVTANYTLTVSNVNEAPTVAKSIADQVFVVGGAVDGYQVSADSFADVDANTTLSYTATLADGSALPAWLSFDAATRTFSGDPSADGSLNIRVTASDGALSVSDDFVLQSVTAPVVQSFTVSDSTTGNGAALGKSGEVLSFVLTMSEPVTSTAGLTAVFRVNGQDVTATSPAVTGASRITLTGVVPATGDGTSISLTSLTSTAAITGDTSAQPMVAPTSGALTYAGYKVDNTAPAVTSTSIDMPENSTAAVALAATDASAVAWTLGTGADSALFAASNGALSLLAAKNYEADPRTYTVNVIATDAAGNVQNQAITVNLTNVNEAPTVANLIPNQAFVVGSASNSYAVPGNTFADPENGTLTYSATLDGGAALPSWLTFNTATRTFSGNPSASGVISVKVSASDGVLSASDVFDLSAVAAPTLTTTLGGVSNLDVRSSIVLSVGETVTPKAGGTITLTDLGGAGYLGESATHTQVLAVDGPHVRIVGTGASTKIIIDPQFELDLASNYSLAVSTGAFAGVSSGQDSVAFAAVNFSTVSPGVSAATGAAVHDVTKAVQAQEMNASTGALQNSLKWLDVTTSGTASSGLYSTADASGADYAFVSKTVRVAKDDVFVDDTYVKFLNFGVGDLFYLDDQINQSTYFDGNTNKFEAGGVQAYLNQNAFSGGNGSSADPFDMTLGSTGSLGVGSAQFVMDAQAQALLPVNPLNTLLQTELATNWSKTGMVIAA